MSRKQDVKVVQELIDEWDMDGDGAILVAMLLEHIDRDVEDIKEVDTDGKFTHTREFINVEIGREEYMCFLRDDDAYDEAVESTIQTIDDIGVTAINGWENHLDDRKTERFFTDVYNEWNHSYAVDIMSESSRKYENRFAEECVELGVCDEDEAESEDFDGYDYIDDFVEKMTDDQIEEGESGMEHYRSNFGDEEASELAIKHGLVDIADLAKYAVDTDGVAHVLASYDGNEIDLYPAGVAYRTN